MKDGIPADARRNVQKHNEIALISQVAHMYYDLGMLQPEIAQRMFFSRSKVSRMLTQARELGIVEINVKHIVDRAPAMEKLFHEHFGVKEALIITCFEPENEHDTFTTLTDFAALHIAGVLRGPMTVGISNGKTVNAVVGKLNRRNPCTLDVVQLMGSASSTFMAEEARNMVDEVVSLFGGKGHFLNTPLYIDDKYARDVLVQDPVVSGVFDKMRECDVVITGIGEFVESQGHIPPWYGYLTERHIAELRQKGAVGSVCAQYFDRDGHIIDCEWNEKCIAMPLKDVRSAPLSIGIASGKSKVPAILGALRGGFINAIVTDTATASMILEQK